MTDSSDKCCNDIQYAGFLQTSYHYKQAYKKEQRLIVNHFNYFRNLRSCSKKCQKCNKSSDKGYRQSCLCMGY